MAKGGSSSSSTSNTTTEQFDQRIAASDQAIVIRLDEGAGLNIDTAIDAGLGEEVSDVLELSLGAVGQAVADAFGFTGSQLTADRDLLRDQLDADREIIAAQLGGEGQTSLKEILKAGVVVAAIAGAVVVAPKVFK